MSCFFLKKKNEFRALGAVKWVKRGDKMGLLSENVIEVWSWLTTKTNVKSIFDFPEKIGNAKKSDTTCFSHARSLCVIRVSRD